MKLLPHCNIKLETFMRLAMEIWGRHPSTVRAWTAEDRRFRESFGCAAVVVLSVWIILAIPSQVPYSEEPKHLFWTLRFMKVHPKENVMCTIIKVKDPKTFRGRENFFISPIVDLEADIVSNPFFRFVFMYVYLICFPFLRLHPTIGCRVI